MVDVIKVFFPSLYFIVGIRQLQLMLLKMALLVGIEIHVNVEFKGLIEPPEDQETESKLVKPLLPDKPREQSVRACKLLRHFYVIHTCCVFLGIGWRAEVHPRTHPVNELEFDVIIGADGRRNTLPGKSWEKCFSNAVFPRLNKSKHKQHCLFFFFLSGLGG